MLYLMCFFAEEHLFYLFKEQIPFGCGGKEKENMHAEVKFTFLRPLENKMFSPLKYTWENSRLIQIVFFHTM